MAAEHADRSRTSLKFPNARGLEATAPRAEQTIALTDEQRSQVKAICDEICERLETSSEYIYALDEGHGKAGAFAEVVWDEALRSLNLVGFDATRSDALIVVRRR
jgi:hypothetical protein